MRLVKQVGRLEAAAAARAEDRQVVGICWTSREERVDAARLVPGEYIAADIQIAADIAGDCRSEFWTVRERVTLDERDLGQVRSFGGDVIGQVVGMDRGLISWQLEDCGSCASADECADAV